MMTTGQTGESPAWSLPKSFEAALVADDISVRGEPANPIVLALVVLLAALVVKGELGLAAPHPGRVDARSVSPGVGARVVRVGDDGRLGRVRGGARESVVGVVVLFGHRSLEFRAVGFGIGGARQRGVVGALLRGGEAVEIVRALEPVGDAV